MTKERDVYWDSLKGVLIILVVLGHVLQVGDSRLTITTISWIYSFHMPLFVFVSGYFSNPDSPSYNKGCFRIIETYVCVQLIRCILEDGLNIHSLLIPKMALWYLLSLFLWKCLLAWCPLKIRENKKALIITSIILSFVGGIFPLGTIMSCSRTFCFLPFFILGYCLRGYDYKRLIDYLNPLYASLLLLVAWVVFYYANKNFIMLFAGTESLYRGIGCFSRQRISILLCSSLMSLCVLSVTTLLAKLNVLVKLGRATLHIYIFHAIIYMYILYPLCSMNMLPTNYVYIYIYSLFLLVLLYNTSRINFFSIILNPFTYIYDLWKTRC